MYHTVLKSKILCAEYHFVKLFSLCIVDLAMISFSSSY